MDCTRVGFATMVSRLPQVPSRSGWRRLGLRGIEGTGPTIALPPVGDADTVLVRTVVSTARTVVTRVFGLYEQRSAAAGGQATTQAVLSFGAMAARLHFCYRSLVASGNVKQLRRWASVSCGRVAESSCVRRQCADAPRSLCMRLRRHRRPRRSARPRRQSSTSYMSMVPMMCLVAPRLLEGRQEKSSDAHHN